MNVDKWPKYLGSFTLYYLVDRCEANCYIGEKLKVIADKPHIDFSINKSGKINSNLHFDKLNVALVTETNQYFSDIEHFYAEIWNFLLCQNYVDLQPTIIDLVQSTYTIRFDVYMKKEVLNIQNVDKDINYRMVKKESIDQQGFREAIYRKEVQKYAKEAFFVLCEILQIKKTITALIKPFDFTLILDELIINKYKSKPFHEKIYLSKNLRLPQIHIKDIKHNDYYSNTQQLHKLTSQNLNKINQSIMSDNSNFLDQDVEEEIKCSKQFFKNYRQSQIIKSENEPNILCINELKSKKFHLSDHPKLLKAQLFPYQLQGLQWMLYRENMINEQQLYNDKTLQQEQGDRRLNKMWSQLELLDQDFIYLNEFSGEINAQFVEFKESLGGIVADQMGLGKTLLSISLILKSQEMILEGDGLQSIPKKKIKYDQGQTLLIVQLSVFGHWINEIEKHTLGNSISVYEYYTVQSRNIDKLDLSVYQVVITTYGILSREYSRKGDLYKYRWKRVILDEAHTIKQRGTVCAQASFHINTDIRWCLTGTPLQNQLDDLFSLFHFLKIDTFSDYFWYNTYINKQKNKTQVYELLHQILEPVLLRRTKTSTYLNGKIMMVLPSKTHEIVKIKLSPEEMQIYQAFYERSKKEFQYLLIQKIVKKSFFHIFSIITFLRQLCDSPFLFLQAQQYKMNQVKAQTLTKLSLTIDNFFAKKQLRIAQSQEQNHIIQTEEEEDFEEEENEDIEEQSESHEQDDQDIEQPQQVQPNKNYQQEMKFKIKGNQIKNEICVICHEKMTQNIALFSCGHVVDYKCFMDLYNSNKNTLKCPLCKAKLNFNDDVKNIQKKTIQQFFNTDATQISSKFQAILNEVNRIIHIGQKVVIYTQWIKVLNFFQSQFMIKGIDYKRLDGSMSKDQRQKNIDYFQSSNCSVFLVSLKVGAYGINLCAANNIILVDPWWNPAVEEQAVERIHRLGQNKPVYIKSFICENTIEERVLELHEIKKKLFQDALHLRPVAMEFNIMEQLKYLLD